MADSKALSSLLDSKSATFIMTAVTMATTMADTSSERGLQNGLGAGRVGEVPPSSGGSNLKHLLRSPQISVEQVDGKVDGGKPRGTAHHLTSGREAESQVRVHGHNGHSLGRREGGFKGGGGIQGWRGGGSMEGSWEERGRIGEGRERDQERARGTGQGERLSEGRGRRGGERLSEGRERG